MTAATRDALRPPPLPHEHGAWVMLGVAAAFGLAAAPAPGPGAWAALPGLLLLFLARYAVLPLALRLTQGKPSPRPFLARRLGWGACYLLLATAFVVLALVFAPAGSRKAAAAAAAVLLALGAAHAGIALVGRDRDAWGEVLGFVGLAAGAPFIAACGGVDLPSAILAPGVLALAYFLSSLVFVRAFRARAAGRARRAAAASLAAHAGIGAALVAAAASGLLPPASALAFAVVIARAAWGAAAPPPSLRALGMRELAVAALFVLLGVAGLRSGI